VQHSVNPLSSKFKRVLSSIQPVEKNYLYYSRLLFDSDLRSSLRQCTSRGNGTLGISRTISPEKCTSHGLHISTTTYVHSVGVHSLLFCPQPRHRSMPASMLLPLHRNHRGGFTMSPQSRQRPYPTSATPAPAPRRNHRSGQIRPRPAHGTRPSYPRPPKSAPNPPSSTERAASIFTTPPPPPRAHCVHQAE
jgi:hypothetical protein